MGCRSEGPALTWAQVSKSDGKRGQVREAAGIRHGGAGGAEHDVRPELPNRPKHTPHFELKTAWKRLACRLSPLT